MKKLLWLLLIAIVSSQTPFTVHDLHAVRRVGAPAVSAHGTVVYPLRYWDESSNTKTTNLQSLTLFSHTISQLTYKSGASDSNPTISPDSYWVAFLSDRSGSSQIFTVPIMGSEDKVVQLTQLPVDVSNLMWGFSDPIGNFLIFSAQVYVDCPTLECTAERDADIAKRGPNTGFIYEKLFVRHWDTWETGKVSHLFLLTLKSDISGWHVTNKPIDLMFGMNASSPAPPDGGLEQIAISPNGTELAFTAEMTDRTEAWTTGWRVYTVDISNPQQFGEPKWITSYTSARTQNPTYSPDGSLIAYLAMDRPGFEADRLHICIFDRQNAQTSKLAYTWDRSVSTLVWSEHGSFLFADADEDGRHKLFAVDVTSGNVTTIIEDGNNANVVTIPNQDIVLLTRDFMVAPADIWAFYFNKGISGLQQITFENLQLLNQFQFSSPQSFYFPSTSDTQVQGWMLKPLGWSPSRTWPVILLIHGGPQGAWNDDWSYRWNPQLWVSRGYAVIAINPHGSTGFGQAFTDAVSKDWGGLPFYDIMNGTQAALQNWTWMDSELVCACGASYGGFMINWINGQTDFFKCLVVHDGAFDTMGLYYSTDELWFNEWEFGGVPWKHPELYDKFNPLRYVANMQTPTLVIHGGIDFRLPIEQGISMFTALQRRGVPSKFLYFPEENHWTLKPQNGIMWYDTVLSWLDLWTLNKPPQ